MPEDQLSQEKIDRTLGGDDGNSAGASPGEDAEDKCGDSCVSPVPTVVPKAEQSQDPSASHVQRAPKAGQGSGGSDGQSPH